MLLHQVDLGALDAAYIIPLSDLHVADPNFDEQKFLRFCTWIQETPNAYVLLLGDLMNTATKNSVSDVYEDVMDPNQQLKYTRKLLEPIKDRVLAIVEGNHERRIKRETAINTTEVLAEMLGLFYSPRSVLLKVRVGKNKHGKPVVYTIFGTHGLGGGRTWGNKANWLRRLGDIVLADVYVMGHVHQMIAFQDVYYIPDLRNNKVDEVKRTYVSSASFVRWGGYAEEKLLPPSKLGAPRIRLDGGKKDVHVSI